MGQKTHPMCDDDELTGYDISGYYVGESNQRRALEGEHCHERDRYGDEHHQPFVASVRA